MCTTHEHSTKVRLNFSGGPHAPVNMADTMEEVNACEKMQEMARLLRCTLYYIFVRQVSKNP